MLPRFLVLFVGGCYGLLVDLRILVPIAVEAVFQLVPEHSHLLRFRFFEIRRVNFAARFRLDGAAVDRAVDENRSRLIAADLVDVGGLYLYPFDSPSRRRIARASRQDE